MSKRMTTKGPVAKLKEELAQTKAELAEVRSLALRTAADFDNARKRWQRDSQEFELQVAAGILKNFCEVWDNFERALKINDTGDANFESYRKGVELIFTQFRDMLSKQGVKQYSMLGSEFDPKRAEAVGHLETNEVEHGKVIEELKKGFMLGERVLRPAQVIVARQVKEVNDEGGTGAETGTSAANSDSQEFDVPKEV